MLWSITELPVEFTRPLSDGRVLEKDTVSLECEVSKPNKTVTWLKNGEVITPSDRFEVRVEGTKHFLTIRNANLDDDAKYTVKIDAVECSAQLTVDGKCELVN